MGFWEKKKNINCIATDNERPKEFFRVFRHVRRLPRAIRHSYLTRSILIVATVLTRRSCSNVIFNPCLQIGYIFIIFPTFKCTVSVYTSTRVPVFFKNKNTKDTIFGSFELLRIHGRVLTVENNTCMV